MHGAAAAVTVAAPAGWSPQTVIAARCPEMIELQRVMQSEIRQIEAELDRDESRGRDTFGLRQTLRELRWRLEYTADPEAARATIARLRARAAARTAPAATTPDAVPVWFLQLDALVDLMLLPDFPDDPGAAPILDRINDPGRLHDYLDGLVVSRIEDDGIDRRKELNFATANLVRLILWQRPRGYPWDSRLAAVIRRFIAGWQDPATGFFGADYLIGGRRLRTVDLSLTFHMARYLEGRIGYWPQLIETLIEIRNRRYPNGWLDEIGMTSHNNYDVAVLFQLGWPQMRPDQRQRGAAELTRLVDWCLTTAIAPDGEIAARAVAESLPESYYFTIAFLDTVGYFEPAKRFWTERDFPGAAGLRARLEDGLSRLPAGEPMVRMARQRLGARPPHNIERDRRCR